MAPKRVLCGYGSDLDAVAHYLHTRTGKAPDLADVSRGFFGAQEGTKRLLKLFAQKNIKASWFVPGHTLESFPEEMKAIRDQGHEISLHMYTHEDPETLSAEQFEKVMVKTHKLVTDFTGKPPKGFTAPCWANHAQQIAVCEKLGIEYDHSFMHTDFQPYWAPSTIDEYVSTNVEKDPDTWMKPMKIAKPSSSVVEIPANWTLDDWPPFQFNWRVVNSQGYVSPAAWAETVKDQFTYCYENYDTFIFPITIHPQVSGRPHILKTHERIIDWINTHENVEWMTFAEMAAEFKAGKIGTGKLLP